jgi:hypothetical protein
MTNGCQYRKCLRQIGGFRKIIGIALLSNTGSANDYIILLHEGLHPKVFHQFN